MAKTRRQLALQSRQSSPSVVMEQVQHGWQKRKEFSAIPLDILLEIFGHLSPKDLVALSRTNRALREPLHSQSMTIWKSARTGAGLPECAPGFSERQWAIFIFGGTTCQICGGTGDAPKVEFSIRRRVCNSCMNSRMVSDANFGKKFPSYDPSIMDLVPYTHGGGLPSNTGRLRRFFWESDVQRIGEKWVRLQAHADRRSNIAENDAATYRAERVGEVERIMKHAKECQNWLSVFTNKEAEEKWNRRRHLIQDQLMRLGYEKQDIPLNILIEPRFHEGDVLTAALWESIQPELVAKVKALQSSRYFKEQCDFRQTRMDMLQPLYTAYAQSLPPQQWVYLPDIQDLSSLPLFGEILNAERGESITSSSFLPAIGALPTLVPAINTVVKARIAALLGPPSGTVDEPLDLATSVFECGSWCRHRSGMLFSGGEKLALMSWESIVTHLSLSFTVSMLGMDRLNFSSVGSGAAAVLVREAGLDSLRATIAEMDVLDLRFVCRDCTRLVAGQLSAPTVGYPWKPAIEHTLASGHMTWERMSPRETIRIKQAERYDEGNERSWSCNHCAVYFKNWDTKPGVVQHLNDVHGIASPVEPDDVFWYPGKRRHPLPGALGSFISSGSI